MKKALLIVFIIVTTYIYSQKDDVLIQLPNVDIKIEDTKKFELDIKPDIQKITDDIQNVDIPKPDITEIIKVDLEKTLPEKIDLPEKQKPVDALITAGYGLNNLFYSEFFIFVKRLNPNIAVHYLRKTKESFWFYDPNVRNPSSLDDLSVELLYNYKILGLGSELGYYSYSYKLQNKSIYDELTKRIINIDLSPSIKFNYQNDITLRLLNTFLLSNFAKWENNYDVKRLDFGYLLNSDISYNQIFRDNHFLSVHAGYDFNYLEDYIDGDNDRLNDYYKRLFYNNFKMGISYSTTLLESFFIKVATDFVGLFKNYNFNWYILPDASFGYSFKNYFHCYIEGGGSLTEKPDRYWYKENNYVVYPMETVPGYHWFAKTGLRGSFTGWLNVYTDLEFAYNMNGPDWKLSTNAEKLYSFTTRSYYELNLTSGVDFQVKEYFTFKVEHMHRFMDMMHFKPRDEIKANMTWHIPKIGLSFFLDFNAGLFRKDLNNKYYGNIYMMNAGIDWTYHDKIGIGTKFSNILCFQDYYIMPEYKEPGFEFVTYIKIGF